jgi:hypothetical protein
MNPKKLRALTHRLVRHIAVAVAIFPCLAAATHAQPIAFQFNILDPAGQGFNDPVLGPQRFAALQFAGQYWANLLPSAYAGETIHADASFTAPTGVRADSQNIQVFSNFNGLMPNVWYGPALANHLAGTDLASSVPEMAFRYNSTVPWYFGTDGNPGASQPDFVTVTLNLIGHGLGFNTRLFHGDGTFFAAPGFAQYPGVYDLFLSTDPTGGIALTQMTDAERAAAITSDNLYWTGPNAVAANGGVRPKIFAPNPFQSGASISNLDPAAFPNALLRGTSTRAGEVNRPGPVELGMLRDMGWAVVPEPPTALLAACIAVLPFTRMKTHAGKVNA